MTVERNIWERRARRSAIWAAYGDALGFISELADSGKVNWRCGSSRVATTIPWRRKHGGPYGEIVAFRAGCYSDDTQLRLAVCRALGPDGFFDAECFASIELPTWLTYALGAGTGTLRAAENLKKRSSSWASNFSSGKGALYTKGGGNGAAMRIQPHVWSLPHGQNEDFLVMNIFRNAVITHGHPRAIQGACFHGLCLSRAMLTGELPNVEEWNALCKPMDEVPVRVKSDPVLGELWLPQWEKEAGTTFTEAWFKVTDELTQAIQLVTNILRSTSRLREEEIYHSLVRTLGGFDKETRGSGSVTAILASALATLGQRNPQMALVIGANCLGSDTDTICTMAGALLGTLTEERPDGDIQDEAYIKWEAVRCAEIRYGVPRDVFKYPDPLEWHPPNTRLDAVFQDETSPILAGLGRIQWLPELESSKVGAQGLWQWGSTDFGQTLLLKRREFLGTVGPAFGYYESVASRIKRVTGTKKETPPKAGVVDDGDILTTALRTVIEAKYDPRVVGNILLEISLGPRGLDLSTGLGALIASSYRQQRLDGPPAIHNKKRLPPPTYGA